MNANRITLKSTTLAREIGYYVAQVCGSDMDKQVCPHHSPGTLVRLGKAIIEWRHSERSEESRAVKTLARELFR